MGMFLAVGQGSEQEVRLIHLTYRPAKKAKKKVCLIGKGVTFDSGGYSLKPSDSMLDMKVDMSGAAAVISAIGAIARLGSPHEVHALAACTENMVSGKAYKLGDVLRAMDGTTVEINNTDAEGRLTLGDAITFAREKIAPDEIIDYATLTGACMVALGPHTAGVMSDSAIVGAYLAAASAAGEDMWRLPLNPRLKEQLKSPIADMRNTGERWGGALTAGLFLKHFARDTPWIHVDIAGPASAAREQGAISRGGVGFGVATTIEYLR
jgi:leucyl aminopeptidase